MIIVLCGVRGSGKDTIGDLLVKNHGFTKEAFANPLKAMVEYAFPAFTDEDLYGPSKNRERPYKEYPRHDRTYAYPHCPPDAVWIPLSNGRGHTLVDAADCELVSTRRWQKFEKGRENRTIYAKTDLPGKITIPLHQFLMRAPEGMVIDHINGDGLDNRRKNLRICTVAENRRNERKRIGSGADSHYSPFKGVSWDASRKLWTAKICAGGVTKNLGRTANEREAARLYDVAARESFGDYARLNSDLFVTPRVALQELGTAWGRSLYEDVWIDAAFERITGLVQLDFVITDGRFKNEVRRSRELGGITVLLTRGLQQSTDPHPSEAELKTIDRKEFDFIFDNANYTLEQLSSAVELMLKEFGYGAA